MTYEERLSERYAQEFDRRIPRHLHPPKRKQGAGPLHKIKPDKYDEGWCRCNSDHSQACLSGRGQSKWKALRTDYNLMRDYFKLVRAELKHPLAAIKIT